MLLSKAGRTCLSSYVFNVMANYIMSALKIPKNIIKKIDKLRWGKKNKSFCRFICWQNIYRSKLDGGYGIKSMKNMNIVLLTKSAWRIVSNLYSLSKVLMAEYEKGNGW